MRALFTTAAVALAMGLIAMAIRLSATEPGHTDREVFCAASAAITYALLAIAWRPDAKDGSRRYPFG